MVKPFRLSSLAYYRTHLTVSSYAGGIRMRAAQVRRRTSVVMPGPVPYTSPHSPREIHRRNLLADLDQ